MGKYRFKRLSDRLRLRILPMLVFLSLSSFLARSQNTGFTVLNSKLEPLAGASVATLDGGFSTTTDSLGRTRGILIDPEGEITWVISFVGYEGKRVGLAGGEWKRVILAEDTRHLNAVEVQGFLEDRALNKQAGSVSKIDLGALNRYSNESLVQAINSVPGIRFEERAGASYRISIRGSSIRSPFGVRNVKVYWNGIPFTEPGGNTFINLLDLANVSNVEVIRGPAASMYGAGNGGVLKLKSTDLSSLANATALKLSVGSFGRFKYSAAMNVLKENSSLTFKWAAQKSDGYREHNEMDRKVFEFDGLFFPGKNSTISTSFLYSDLFYEIPGGLNPEQRDANPRMPRPLSEERNASVANEFYLLKLGHELNLGAGIENTTALSVSFSEFENPFILDYKKDNQQVFALRSEFKAPLDIAGKPGVLTFGVEHQNSFFDGKNFGNVQGQADTIRFADEVRSRQSLGFANYAADLSDSWSLTAGISWGKFAYDIDRSIDEINNDPQRFEKTFDAVWSPRIALSKTINDNHSLHISVSKGFSPPTTTEVRTNQGSLNESIQGEKGTNYELNFRGELSRFISFDVALFHFRLKDAITTITDRQGVQLFRNSGATEQNGLELQLKGDWLNQPRGMVHSFRSSLAYTYHDFAFEDYVDSGDDFSGNALPGTAPHVLNLQTDLVLTNGLYLNATYHYSDPIPLNDENTFFSRAYQLVNLKAGFKGQLGTNTNYELFFGVENLLNVSYSLGNDLNAFARRYYQPAPEINYYLGLKLKFDH